MCFCWVDDVCLKMWCVVEKLLFPFWKLLSLGKKEKKEQ